MYDGIINVYKEPGFTSFDVVAKLRGILGQKKIGHTGTLDPAAEGVLPVCLGKATKVCDLLTDRDKTYQAVMLLGVETDTQDMTGQVLSERPTDGITEAMLREALEGFVGEIDQIPPMYSALKVDGKKLCDLARKGQTVERKPRRITIYDIHVDEIALPRVTMTVRCSKGTYIRTLCHDIGEQLGCHAALEHLLRTEASGYRVEDSLRLGEIEVLRDQGVLAERIRPIEDVFHDYPAIRTIESADRFLYNGNSLLKEDLSGESVLFFERDYFSVNANETESAGNVMDSENIRSTLIKNVPKDGCGIILTSADSRCRVYDSSGKFAAIYRYSSEKTAFCPVKMFL